MVKICEYLTFKDRCILGAVNKRIQSVLTFAKFWHTISIPRHTLKYDTLNKLINMGTQVLNIPWSSIDGEWKEQIHLREILCTNSSRIQHLNWNSRGQQDNGHSNRRISTPQKPEYDSISTPTTQHHRHHLTRMGPSANTSQLVRRGQ